MKRTVAIVALLTALGVLCKLAFKEDGSPALESSRVSAGPAEPDPEAALRAKYPEDRELVERVLSRYRQTALAIERNDSKPSRFQALPKSKNGASSSTGRSSGPRRTGTRSSSDATSALSRTIWFSG